MEQPLLMIGLRVCWTFTDIRSACHRTHTFIDDEWISTRAAHNANDDISAVDLQYWCDFSPSEKNIFTKWANHMQPNRCLWIFGLHGAIQIIVLTYLLLRWHTLTFSSIMIWSFVSCQFEESSRLRSAIRIAISRTLIPLASKVFTVVLVVFEPCWYAWRVPRSTRISSYERSEWHRTDSKRHQSRWQESSKVARPGCCRDQTAQTKTQTSLEETRQRIWPSNLSSSLPTGQCTDQCIQKSFSLSARRRDRQSQSSHLVCCQRPTFAFKIQNTVTSKRQMLGKSREETVVCFNYPDHQVCVYDKEMQLKT